MKKYLILFLMSVLLYSCENLSDSLGIQEIETEAGALAGKALFLNEDDSSGIVISLEKTDGLRSLASESRDVSASTTTDKDGNYRISDLDMGVYTVYASSKNSSERAVSRNNIVVDSREVTVEDLFLTPVGSVSGTVIVDDSTDKSIGVLVSIAGTSYMSTTDSLGKFKISDVPVGSNYMLVLTKGTDLFVVEDTISVKSGEITKVEDIEVTLSQNNQSDGTVIGIQWKGSLSVAPENPEINWAYYNSEDGISYIYDGSIWQILAKDGQNGSDGKSAFDLWLIQGNEGSEDDFLTSLKGQNGLSAYDIWIILGNTGPYENFISDIKGADGLDGSPGLSAYDIWLSLGNNGSEEDFINSLYGADGQSSYETWIDIGNNGSETEFINSLKGADGQSAYELWLSLGNSGTMEDFFNSLLTTGSEEQVVTDSALEGIYWNSLEVYSTFDLENKFDISTSSNEMYYFFENGNIYGIIYDAETGVYEKKQAPAKYSLSSNELIYNTGESIEYSITGSQLILKKSEIDIDDLDQDGDTSETYYRITLLEYTSQDIIDNISYLFSIGFYNTDSSIPLTFQTVENGDLLSVPEEPVKEGYTFIGWFTDSDLTKEWNFENDTVTNAMNLYAGFTPEPLVPYLNGNPYFDKTTALVGDVVKVIVPVENDDNVSNAYTFILGANNDAIDGVSLYYSSDLAAWVGEFTITQYFPSEVTLEAITLTDADYGVILRIPNSDFDIPVITVTDSTPDTTAPVFESVSFSTDSASVGDTVYLYAVFSDPETGIMENWSSSIVIENTASQWMKYISGYRYSILNDRYEVGITITEEFPSVITIKSLWAKNGIGVTAKPEANTDFTSPVLTIN